MRSSITSLPSPSETKTVKTRRSRTKMLSPATNSSNHDLVNFQEKLPTEIWQLVVGHIPALDLFSLYNTSTFMRALTSPLLVQAVATTSLRLFVYQEYVRRVGIKFVFDHFDMDRDRVVFKPHQLDNQFRFRSGLTLQSPQLEEAAVKSTGVSIQLQQVRRSGDNIFTVHTTKQNSKSEENGRTSVSTSSPIDIVDPASEGNMQGQEDEQGAENILPEAHRPPSSKGSDDRHYQGNQNFFDKTCPLQIRKGGVRKIDGTRYCFSQDYPWTLQYEVGTELLDPPATLSSQKKGTSEEHSGSTGVSGEEDGGQAPSSHGSTGSGPRYLRMVRFECSMNFLDSKRATRNVIGRWLEGKMQQWKRVLGGRRQQPHSRLHVHMQPRRQTRLLPPTLEVPSREYRGNAEDEHEHEHEHESVRYQTSSLGTLPAATLVQAH
ncbi:hypothetical protein MVEG_02047 [Podila verticillata NRRL 6337]|nr:hypothetical protein MVEG_02047 [Podila verticillata NRRL 6337]